MGLTLASAVELISRTVLPAAPAIDRAAAIYDWMAKNIEYDLDRKKAIDDCIDDGLPYEPEYTLERRKGVCSDMAVLYVEIARKMRLKAYYAHVSVDSKGAQVSHACAVVRVKEGNILVDVAYRQFNAMHRHYFITEPRIKRRDGIIYAPRRVPCWRHIAAAASLLVGIAACIPNISCQKGKEIMLLETKNEARFYSPNGSFFFSYDDAAAKALKEYVFIVEAKEGRLSDQKLFENYNRVDRNRNSIIEAEEAVNARDAARSRNLQAGY
ncbi:MAG: transglutaminase domain-containing protein [Candidatus Woesearchaeota archaeon]